MVKAALGLAILMTMGASVPIAMGAWAQGAIIEYKIEGDAIPQSLTGRPGDAARGRSLVIGRQTGLCLLCHSGPFPDERFQGTLAPSLAGAGTRLTPGQLRLRLVDSRRLHPDTIMPSYYALNGVERVARGFAGKTILNAAEIEDVVAFLTTLRE